MIPIMLGKCDPQDVLRYCWRRQRATAAMMLAVAVAGCAGYIYFRLCLASALSAFLAVLLAVECSKYTKKLKGLPAKRPSAPSPDGHSLMVVRTADGVFTETLERKQ